jgi:hypothetical protein
MGLKSNIINGLKKEYPNIQNTEIKYYFRGNHPVEVVSVESRRESLHQLRNAWKKQ